jgi:hypothetical protein
MSRLSHSEIHMVHRIGWLRAAVLGANDGLVSTASLVVGVAAAGSGKPGGNDRGPRRSRGRGDVHGGRRIRLGQLADRCGASRPCARETRELADTPEAELEELTRIYVDRGLDRDLAEKVALQLTERDALGSHARDELGISETVTAHPVQAALVSAATFAVGAVVPLIIAVLAPASADLARSSRSPRLQLLPLLGGLGASAGGAGTRSRARSASPSGARLPWLRLQG